MTPSRLFGFIVPMLVLAVPVDAQALSPLPASPSPQAMHGMESMQGMQASPAMGGLAGTGQMPGGQGTAGTMSMQQMQQMIANCNSMCMRHEAMRPWLMAGGIAFSALGLAALLLLVVLEVIWVRLWLGRLDESRSPRRSL